MTGLDINKNINDNNDDSIRLDDDLINFDNDDKNSTGVSHSPLALGSKTASPKPAVAVGPAVPKFAAPPAPAAKKEPSKTAPGERITSVKTFFTKLHSGALDFLDGQICDWLRSNPNIVIKQINTATGVVSGKKDEPSIIITVWY